MSILYRLTRDDGVELDVTRVVWESVLAVAYRNGWTPAGTEAPPMSAWSRKTPDPRTGEPGSNYRPWRHGDYFSMLRQRVGQADALAFAGAAHRGALRRARVGVAPSGHESGAFKVATFARGGAFVIGRAPAPLHRTG